MMQLVRSANVTHSRTLPLSVAKQLVHSPQKSQAQG